jgi:hypothetical protein
VDIEFRLFNDFDNSDLSEAITELRRDYAQDLLDDKKFFFGKCIVSSDGTVCTLSFHDMLL